MNTRTHTHTHTHTVVNQEMQTHRKETADAFAKHFEWDGFRIILFFLIFYSTGKEKMDTREAKVLSSFAEEKTERRIPETRQSFGWLFTF